MGASFSSQALSTVKYRKLASEYRDKKLQDVKESYAIYKEIIQKDDLDFADFEETFGLLIGDSEQHFELFQEDGSDVVSAAEVFSAVAVFVVAEIGHKINFVFSMFTEEGNDTVISISNLEKLIEGFTRGISKMLRLSDLAVGLERVLIEIPAKHLESGIMTSAEFANWVSTNILIKTFIDQIDLIASGLSNRDEALEFFQNAALWEENDDENQMEDEYMHNANKNPLWINTVEEICLQSWIQEPLELPSSTHCLIALKKMQILHAKIGLVYDENMREDKAKTNCKYSFKYIIGVFDHEKLLHYLFHFLPEFEFSFDKDEENNLLNTHVSFGNDLRHEIEINEGGRKFSTKTLKDLLCFANDSTPEVAKDSLETNSLAKLHRVNSDSFLFDLVCRFANGEGGVATFQDFKHPDVFLGISTPLSIIRFIMEDFSVLNGKHVWRISSFSFCYIPATVRLQNTTIIEVYKLIVDKNISGVALVNEAHELVMTFSAENLDELVKFWPKNYGDIPDKIEASVSIPYFGDFIKPISAIFDCENSRLDVVKSTDTLASVICKFFDLQTSRLYVIEEVDELKVSSWKLCGVVRIVDIMQLLLKEQAHYTNKDTT